MKTLTNRALLVLTVALCVVAAQAQSTVMLKGTVPFNFIAGDQSLPSGDYSVTALDQEIECWFDQNGRGLFMLRTIPMGKQDNVSSTKLVFHRYGNDYYLAEIWSAGVSHEVQASRSQKRLAKTQKYEIVAVLMPPHR